MKHVLFTLVLGLVILSSSAYAGGFSIGIPDNPDKWPSLTVDYIYNTLSGDQNIPADFHSPLFTAAGFQSGFESLAKFPLASRITFRIGVSYLWHSVDNTMLGTKLITNDDYGRFGFRVGVTLYMPGSGE